MKIKLSVNEPLGKWISRLYKHHENYINNKLNKYNLKHNEANLLMHLFHNSDGINQETLTNELGIDKATVSRAVNGLLKNNYLTRRKSTKDKRVYLIFLSKKAKKFEPVIKEVFQNWFSLIMKDIPENEIKIIVKNFKKMYNLVQHQL